MNLSATLRGTTYGFAHLREVMAKANEEKSGDKLAGVAARSAEERVAAKRVLADVDERTTGPATSTASGTASPAR